MCDNEELLMLLILWGLWFPLTRNFAGLSLQPVASDSTFTGGFGYNTRVLLAEEGRELIRIVGCFNTEV